jgi:hypothetical protein
VRPERGLPEVDDLGSEQTGAETRNCGPEEHCNERRCLQMIVMMSPVVALAKSKVGSRQRVTAPG